MRTHHLVILVAAFMGTILGAGLWFGSLSAPLEPPVLRSSALRRQAMRVRDASPLCRKPGAPIRLEYELSREEGETLVTARLFASRQFDQLTVEWCGVGDVEIEGAETRRLHETVAAGRSRLKWEKELRCRRKSPRDPQDELGPHCIAVVAKVEFGGRTEVRTFAIPIEDELADTASQKPDSSFSESPVRSFRASETARTLP